MDSTSTKFGPFAMAHIDGELDCESLKVEVLKTENRLPAVFFRVIAGDQPVPVWATDKLAAKVICYSQVARDNGQCHIEVNLAAHLISDSRMTCPIAFRITWHTSSRIRAQADAMTSAMIIKKKGPGR